MIFISYAQNLEDLILWRALKYIENGFYIDVGAWSPDVDSVTHAFYERGWHGINIEPNHEFYQQLKDHRPLDINCNVAVGYSKGSATMYFVGASGLSSLKPTNFVENIIRKDVPVTTLAALWTRYVPEGQDVHFLKIDVEGSEKAVLRGNDWNNHRPWIVVVEATYPNTQKPNYEIWESIFFENNYLFVYDDGLNRYYLAEEHSELRLAFKYPPNIFDRYTTISKYKADQNLIVAENKIEEYENKIEEYESKIEEYESKIEEHENKIEDCNQLLDDIFNSKSWRLTAPLRKIKIFLRSIEIKSKITTVNDTPSKQEKEKKDTGLYLSPLAREIHNELLEKINVAKKEK